MLKLIFKTIILTISATAILLVSFNMVEKGFAYSTECPKTMSDAECLVFLQQQSESLAKEKQQINQALSKEQYDQLSLIDKINYLDSQVISMQKTIDKLEIEIGTRNVEIKILAREIVELENNINTIEQEVHKLESSVQKRVSLSYKYSFITPVEMLFENSNFENLLRKLKYLTETKKKDKELLSNMTDKSNSLRKEKEILAIKQNEIEKKRIEIENEKSEQFKVRKDLDKQKQQRSILYAESKRREKELLTRLENNRITQSKLDSAIIEYIAKTTGKAVYGGNVNKGQVIGTMGNTGLSYGAHLHFSIGTSNQWAGYGNVDPWNGYLKKGPDYWNIWGGWTYYYIRSGTMQVPLAGSVVLTQEFHQGTAVDMVSLMGEGAPVYAAWAGKIYSGVDQYGGRYAWIEHSNGLKTTYLHLKDVYVLK